MDARQTCVATLSQRNTGALHWRPRHTSAAPGQRRRGGAAKTPGLPHPHCTTAVQAAWHPRHRSSATQQPQQQTVLALVEVQDAFRGPLTRRADKRPRQEALNLGCQRSQEVRPRRRPLSRRVQRTRHVHPFGRALSFRGILLRHIHCASNTNATSNTRGKPRDQHRHHRCSAAKLVSNSHSFTSSISTPRRLNPLSPALQALSQNSEPDHHPPRLSERDNRFEYPISNAQVTKRATTFQTAPHQLRIPRWGRKLLREVGVRTKM